MNPPVVAKQGDVLQIGLLGAAQIAPSAVISPARNHQEVTLAAVACRDKNKGDKFAKTHGIPHVYYGSVAYQGLYFGHFSKHLLTYKDAQNF